MVNAYQPTYTSLLSELQDICENTNEEFVANLPRILQRAQDQVQRDLGLDMWRTIETVTLDTTGQIARDSDWLVIRSIWLPVRQRWVEQRTYEYVRQYRGIGVPKVYAVRDEATLVFGPTPNSTYLAEIATYQRLAALSGSNESNWITDNAGDLLLLQALINSSSYLVNTERVQEFGGMYQQVLPTAVSELRDSERRRDTPVRSAPRPTMQAGASQ